MRVPWPESFVAIKPELFFVHEWKQFITKLNVRVDVEDYCTAEATDQGMFHSYPAFVLRERHDSQTKDPLLRVLVDFCLITKESFESRFDREDEQLYLPMASFPKAIIDESCGHELSHEEQTRLLSAMKQLGWRFEPHDPEGPDEISFKHKFAEVTIREL